MKRLAVMSVCLLVLGVFGLNMGCGTIYKTAADERSIVDQIDDQAIALGIEKDFLANDSLKFLDFSAYSYLGNVYIIGEYEKKDQISLAKKIARAHEGVRSVSTYLLPKHDSTCNGLDRFVTKSEIGSKLIQDKKVWGTNVNVQMVQCDVVLMGILGSQSEINRAVSIVKGMPGYKNLKSFLLVEPK